MSQSVFSSELYQGSLRESHDTLGVFILYVQDIWISGLEGRICPFNIRIVPD